MPEPVIFTDQTSGATGTTLQSGTLNTYIVSGTALLQGTTPSAPGSGLVLTYAQQQFVVQANTAGVDAGTSATFFTLAGSTLTVAASKDTYIEVSATGTITQNAVTNGAGAPTQTSNTIRLWKVVSNASNITGVTLLAPLGAVVGTPLTTQQGVLLGNGAPASGPDLHSDGTNVYVETNGAGSIYFRPNGVSSNTNYAYVQASGQLVVTAGGAAITGNSTVTGTLTASNAIKTGAGYGSGGATVQGNGAIFGVTVTCSTAMVVGDSSGQGTLTLKNAAGSSWGTFAETASVLLGSLASPQLTAGGPNAGSTNGAVVVSNAAGSTITQINAATASFAGSVTITNGLTVSAGGAAITGHSSVTSSSTSTTAATLASATNPSIMPISITSAGTPTGRGQYQIAIGNGQNGGTGWAIGQKNDGALYVGTDNGTTVTDRLSLDQSGSLNALADIVTGRHMLVSAGVPTVAVGSGAGGIGASVGIGSTSTDTLGVLTFSTAGTGVAAGTIVARMTYANAYASAPHPIPVTAYIQPVGGGAASFAAANGTNNSATFVDWITVNAIPANTTLALAYLTLS